MLRSRDDLGLRQDLWALLCLYQAPLSAGVHTGWQRDQAQEEREESGVSMETLKVDLITRARSGDGEAFRAFTEPCRRELQVR